MRNGYKGYFFVLSSFPHPISLSIMYHFMHTLLPATFASLICAGIFLGIDIGNIVDAINSINNQEYSARNQTYPNYSSLDSFSSFPTSFSSLSYSSFTFTYDAQESSILSEFGSSSAQSKRDLLATPTATVVSYDHRDRLRRNIVEPTPLPSMNLIKRQSSSDSSGDFPDLNLYFPPNESITKIKQNLMATLAIFSIDEGMIGLLLISMSIFLMKRHPGPGSWSEFTYQKTPIFYRFLTGFTILSVLYYIFGIISFGLFENLSHGNYTGWQKGSFAAWTGSSILLLITLIVLHYDAKQNPNLQSTNLPTYPQTLLERNVARKSNKSQRKERKRQKQQETHPNNINEEEMTYAISNDDKIQSPPPTLSPSQPVFQQQHSNGLDSSPDVKSNHFFSQVEYL